MRQSGWPRLDSIRWILVHRFDCPFVCFELGFLFKLFFNSLACERLQHCSPAASPNTLFRMFMVCLALEIHIKGRGAHSLGGKPCQLRCTRNATTARGNLKNPRAKLKQHAA